MNQKKIVFRLTYATKWGQLIRLVFNEDISFNEKTNTFLDGETSDGQHWEFKSLNIPNNFYYKYQVLDAPKIIEEANRPRFIDISKIENPEIVVNDFWRIENAPNEIFYSSAFQDVIFNPVESKKAIVSKGHSNLSFRLNSASIPKNKIVGLVGNIAALGNWVKPVILNSENYPVWQADILCHDDTGIVEYKYVLVDPKTKLISYWEIGDNRQLSTYDTRHGLFEIIHDEGFRYGGDWWKGSGIALPVFSLRSKNSCGIGEFTDLKLLIDLTEKLGMDMIQTLPVNDTLANMSWTDSYPYAAISVYALHPLYIRLDDIDDLTKYEWYKFYEEEKQSLNDTESVDFERVLQFKTSILRKIYQSSGAQILKSNDCKDYIKSNNWIKAYCVFCHLRDIHKTPDFSKWKDFEVYNPTKIEKFWSKNNPSKDVGFYVFIQYFLDKQLKEVKQYGRSKGIVLKGDLPIGIYRFSCDAWVSPNLFNMDQQAGAPPDDYAVNGQNWGFPTYNWEEMSKDGFAWWQSRMTQLSVYFDALRIDHILGFFRIWSIPMNQVSGTMGMFYPRLPIHINEIFSYGLKGDILRYTMPYIRTYILQQLFGAEWENIVKIFLEEVFDDAYVFKSAFDTQQKLSLALETKEYSQFQVHSAKLMSMISDVLLIEEPNGDGLYFNPRISLQKTFSYRDLDDYSKKAIDKLYVDYFYNRHNEFWKKQAYWKLPPIIKSTNMLICGEDLGMIPSTVPEVMENLNIIPLEIQRMPKSNTIFGDCNSYKYMSVCSPSCHDMSTIRGWWESNPQLASKFYNLYMKWSGLAPRECQAEIVKFIIEDHLDSKSILAIFPIQDLLGMDDQLKMKNPFAEQINEPANPKHYWRYRLHVNLEDIIKNKDFINLIRQLVKKSGR